MRHAESFIKLSSLLTTSTTFSLTISTVNYIPVSIVEEYFNPEVIILFGCMNERTTVHLDTTSLGKHQKFIGILGEVVINKYQSK